MSGTKIWQSERASDDVLTVGELVAAPGDRAGQEDQRGHPRGLNSTVFRHSPTHSRALPVRDLTPRERRTSSGKRPRVIGPSGLVRQSARQLRRTAHSLRRPATPWYRATRRPMARWCSRPGTSVARRGGCRSGGRRRPAGVGARSRLAERAGALERLQAGELCRAATHWPTRSCSRPASSAARPRPRSRPCSTASTWRAARWPASSTGAGRPRRAAALPAARGGRRDRPVQLSAPPLPRPRRAGAAHRQHRGDQAERSSRRCAASATPRRSQAADLPAGVVNVVIGAGEVGAALVEQSAVRGLCFTGSWPIGRRILAAVARSPRAAGRARARRQEHLRRARRLRAAPGGARGRGRRLPVGRPALHRHRARAGPPQDRRSLHRRARRRGPRARGSATPTIRRCSPGRWRPRPRSPRSRPRSTPPARPAPSRSCRARGSRAGSYRTASLHRLPDGVHHVAGYTDVEVFGPDLCVEVIDGDDEAIAVIEASPYGFANAVFTGSRRGSSTSSPRTRSGILQPQPLDQPGQPQAAVRRRGQERQLPADRRVGAAQRDLAGRDAREPARRGHRAPPARRAVAAVRSRPARAASTPTRRPPRPRAT